MSRDPFKSKVNLRLTVIESCALKTTLSELISLLKQNPPPAASESPGEYVLGLDVIKSILKKLEKIVPADLDKMISARMGKRGSEMN